ncbi:unnamed protein product [Thelazia callipaeda]|uniref:BTB domain-containing protein n=1 Tax=Thelazia callipaeda TaxID=103827 RepID=A0A0N5CRF2_THECL|nr:unnamed protein product [Thelazia callipaeda]
MANFIKKIVDRARSRSSSPTKYQNNDSKRWKQLKFQPLPPGVHSYPIYAVQPKQSHTNHTSCCSKYQNNECCNVPINNTTLPPTANTSQQFLYLKPLTRVGSGGNCSEVDSVDIQVEVLDSVSSHDHQLSKHSLKKIHLNRPRSARSNSPLKKTSTSPDVTSKKSRSKSPTKKTLQITNTLDYLSVQCASEGCSAALIVEDTKFLVCKHQLSHASDYFRTLFLTNKSMPLSGSYQNSCNEFAIIVSTYTHPPPALQFKWFLESTIQSPLLNDITDETLETCMRLSKRFRAMGLEARCSRYIQDNVAKKTPLVALCWLNWILKHKFDRNTYDACLPNVATASLQCLERHRNMISERLLADLLAAKLRTIYDQAVTVFQTIHNMDHFHVDVDRCPRCGRQQEQGKVRVQASPCKKLLGCERCMKHMTCELNGKNREALQACYQCPHGLIPLNDHTPDCQCQIPILASHLKECNFSFLPDQC